MDKSSSRGQRVRIQNKYAVAEYDSLEQAAESLSQVGAMSKDEIMALLRDRTGYVNGYVVTYPETSSDEP